MARNSIKPLSTWLTRKAGRKSIGDTPLADQADAKRVNNFDQDGPAAITDGCKESDPNAMGPRMRPVYDATAGHATGQVDDHDRDHMLVNVHPTHGDIGVGAELERLDGPDGSW